MIVSVPSSAFGEEPGHRRVHERHAALLRAARRSAAPRAGPIVDMSMHSRPGPCPAPSSPSSTDSTWSPSTTIVITTSLFDASACGEEATAAPWRAAHSSRRRGGAVPDRQLEPGAREVRRHARAHDPEPDEADAIGHRQRGSDSTNSTNLRVSRSGGPWPKHDERRLERGQPARRLAVQRRVGRELHARLVQPGDAGHDVHVVQHVAGDQRPVRLPPVGDVAGRVARARRAP